jgi:cell wall-associated NlpC family hydrolase
MRWADRYVGTPFVARGRELVPGLDCWGLVRLVLLEQAGIEVSRLDALDIDSPRAITREIEESAKSWLGVPFTDICEFDLLCMWSEAGHSRMLLHVGIVPARGWVLHTEEATGCVCVPTRHPSVRDRIGRALRHVDSRYAVRVARAG